MLYFFYQLPFHHLFLSASLPLNNASNIQRSVPSEEQWNEILQRIRPGWMQMNAQKWRLKGTKPIEERLWAEIIRR